LSLLMGQVALGLVAGDPDDGAVGPLNNLVSFGTAALATEVHEFLFNVIIAFLVLHVGAIMFHVGVKRDNLLGPMVTGRKTYASSVSQPEIASPAYLAACALVAGGVAWWLRSGAPI